MSRRDREGKEGEISNRAFFSFVAFGLAAIVIVVGIIVGIRSIGIGSPAASFKIQSIDRRSFQPVFVNNADLANKPLFGNIIHLSDMNGEVKALCGQSCDTITLSVDASLVGALYPVKDAMDQYLFLCGYVSPRFTSVVNQGASQRCLDDYRGDHQLSLSFVKGNGAKTITSGFNNFVLK